MTFRILVYLIMIITGILIKIFGLGVDKQIESWFAITVILLGSLNIVLYYTKKIK